MVKDWSNVCEPEAEIFRESVIKNHRRNDLFDLCKPQKDAFDKCVSEWRAKVGSSVKIRGDHPGEPPPQCQALSCLIQRCMSETKGNFVACAKPMALFKHCVKALYGSEYVTD